MSAAVPLAAQPANGNQPLKDLYEVGEIPPLGHVPANMHAWCIRQERHGAPDTAMQIEVVPTWAIGEDEVLVLVMAPAVILAAVIGVFVLTIFNPLAAGFYATYERLKDGLIRNDITPVSP